MHERSIAENSSGQVMLQSRFPTTRYNSKSIRYKLQKPKSRFDTQLNLIRCRIWTREFLKNIRAFDSNDGITVYFPVSPRDDYGFI